MENKYSLWIVPKASEGQKLQEFTNELSEQFGAPKFVPHVTLVANIIVKSDQELNDAKERVSKLSSSMSSFEITLSDFGYKDEEFRCLYLLAQPSAELNTMFLSAAEYFPQVTTEHFAAMPHMSILYGNYNSTMKDEIINKYKNSGVSNITFSVNSFDLFLTNSPTDSWRLEQQFDLAT